MKRRLLITAIAIFLVSLAVYNANLRTIGAGDTVPAALTPIALLTKDSLVMDEYYEYYSSVVEVPYFFHKTPYGYIPAYPLATGLLITPFYAIPVAVFSAHDPTTAEWIAFATVAEKITASATTALSAVVFFLVALALSRSRNIALILTTAYAFGSQAWATSSQALWMHGPGTLFILMSCLIALRHRENPSIPKAIWVSVTLSISVLIRPTNILFAVPIYFWLCVERPRYIWAYTAPTLVFGAMLVFYNLSIFGSIKGRYAPFGLDTPLWEGLAGVLVSPSRGLFPYFPIGLLGIAGFFRALIKDIEYRSFFIALGLFALSQVVIFSLFVNWWGGHSYGPRYMTEIQPVLLLFAIPFLQAPKQREWRYAVLGILLSWSVFIQAVGTFLYPIGGWNVAPASIDESQARLWDARDNPVSRDLAAFLFLNGIIKPDPLDDVNAGYEVTSNTIEIVPGKRGEIDVTVVNSGKSTWFNTFGCRHAMTDLSYHIVDTDGDVIIFNGSRAYLPHDVDPGETVSLKLRVAAPPDSGSYTVEISMVEEGVKWFSERGVPPLTVELVVK